MRRSHAPALFEQLAGWHERVFRAQAVSHDAQAVEGGLVQVRTLKPAYEFKRVHAGHGVTSESGSR